MRKAAGDSARYGGAAGADGGDLRGAVSQHEPVRRAEHIRTTENSVLRGLVP